MFWIEVENGSMLSALGDALPSVEIRLANVRRIHRPTLLRSFTTKRLSVHSYTNLGRYPFTSQVRMQFEPANQK